MKNSFEWDARTRRRKRNERRLTRRVGCCCCCCCSRSPSHRENTSMVCTTFNFRLLGNFASHNWVTESLDVLPRTSNIFPLAVWVCFGFCVWLRIENNPYYDQSSISFSAFTFSHIIHDIWIFFAVATYPFECDLTYTHTHTNNYIWDPLRSAKMYVLFFFQRINFERGKHVKTRLILNEFCNILSFSADKFEMRTLLWISTAHMCRCTNIAHTQEARKKNARMKFTQ